MWHGSLCKLLEVLQLMPGDLLCAEWWHVKRRRRLLQRCHRLRRVRAACGGLWLDFECGRRRGGCGGRLRLVAAGAGSGVGRSVGTAQ